MTTETRKLEKKPALGTSASGGLAIGIGIPFAAVGILLMGVATGVIPLDGEPENWVLLGTLAMGAFFGGLGILAIVKGARAVRLTRTRAARRREHPDEPWIYDYEWDPQGVLDRANVQGRGMLLLGVMMISFLGLLAVSAWLSEGTTHLLAPVLGLLTLTPLAFVWQWLKPRLRRRKFGVPFLRFKRFPFFLGENLDVELVSPLDVGVIHDIEVSLRSVEERVEVRKAGQYSTPVFTCYETWCRTVRFEGTGAWNAASGPVPVLLPLPEHGTVTALSDDPPSYWELEIKARTKGLGYEASFLLPVYAGERRTFAAAEASAAPRRQSAPDLNRTELKKGPVRSLPINLAIPVVGAVVALTLSAFLALACYGIIPVESSDPASLPRLGAPFIIGLGFLGIFFARMAFREIRRTERFNRLAGAYPDQLWLADYAWDPTGAVHSNLRIACVLMRGSIVGGTVVFLMFRAILDERNHTAVMTLGGMMMAVAAGVFLWGLFLLIRHLQAGEARLEWSVFPSFLGSVLRANLWPMRGTERAEWIAVTLRCVEEKHEVRGDYFAGGSRAVRYQVYCDSIRFDRRSMPLPVNPITFEFDLPIDGRATRLSSREPVYWEVEAEFDTGEKCTFLVPVYAGPATEMMPWG